MPAPQDDRPFDPGLISRPEPAGRFSAVEAAALVLSLLWLGGVALYHFSASPEDRGIGGFAAMLTLVGALLPVAMIWVAAVTLRTAREMRAEAQRLQGAVDTMRSTWIAHVQNVQSAQQDLRPVVEQKLAEIAAAQRQTETALATFTSMRDASATQPSADRKAVMQAPAPAAAAEEQPALALGTPAEALRPPVSVADCIRALNFPETADDREGFRALRRALEDRTWAKLIRAAQDVLTLLSQDGIYMDDLVPDRARPEIWRRFGQGERGRGIAALGGVRDRSSLALTAGRMRADTIFRDAAHHFLRQFDRSFQDFEKIATDQEVAEFAETRTARAFMLLGRVTGTFD